MANTMANDMNLPKGWKQISPVSIRNDRTETTIEIVSSEHNDGIAQVVLYREAKRSDSIHRRVDNSHSCQL